MSDNIFLDTNILVYAFDASDEKKHQTATNIVNEAFRLKNGVISTQVLKEFFVTVTKKIPGKLDITEAKHIIEKLAFLEVVETTVPLIFLGIDIHKTHPISFWDALIIAAAKVSNCKRLISEDLSSDSTIKGIRIKNPFR
jgi:predicted nucleic acid-binding protein